MHQSVVGVEQVDDCAHRILHKIEENRTFELQKLHIGKLPSLAHTVMVGRTNITKLAPNGLLQINCAVQTVQNFEVLTKYVSNNLQKWI